MPIPTKEPELVYAETERELPARQPIEDSSSLIERIARDPNADVTKLERLIAMQERMDERRAAASFSAAFSAMQGELPVIDERGAILVDEKVRSRYSKYEDIQAAIRPVLQKHGFAIRHRNEVMPDGKLKIVGILSHRDGHSEQDEFLCPPDKSGGKADIQAIGSTRSYGMRYTTIALLNIETRGLDNDGQARATQAKADVPAGYEDWMADMTAVADEGLQALTAAWAKSKVEYRNYTNAHNRAPFAALKQRASKVTA